MMTVLLKKTLFQYVKKIYLKQGVCITNWVLTECPKYFPIHLEKAQIVPTQGIRISGFLFLDFLK